MGTHITNVDPTRATRTILEANNAVVPHGESVEVDSELAERLLSQGGVWARTKTKAAQAAANEEEGE